MLRVIAEHLSESIYPNFLLLDDCLRIYTVENNHDYSEYKIGDYVITNFIFSNLKFYSEKIKYRNNTLIKIKYSEDKLKIKNGLKVYKFRNNIIRKYSNNNLMIRWNEENEIVYIQFSNDEYVHLNIKDVEYFIERNFPFSGESVYDTRIYKTSYKVDRFYCPDNYVYKLYTNDQFINSYYVDYRINFFKLDRFKRDIGNPGNMISFIQYINDIIENPFKQHKTLDEIL